MPESLLQLLQHTNPKSYDSYHTYQRERKEKGYFFPSTVGFSKPPAGPCTTTFEDVGVGGWLWSMPWTGGTTSSSAIKRFQFAIILANGLGLGNELFALEKIHWVSRSSTMEMWASTSRDA